MQDTAGTVERHADMSRRIEWALSGVWWFALSGLGLFFPFYSLYLRHGAGLSGTAVGVVVATMPAMGLIAQPFWGQLADRTGARTRVLTVIALGTAAGYAALMIPTTQSGFIVATALFAAFSTALIPTCVSVSLASLPNASPHAFGRVRVLGTIGFGVCVGLAPFALASLGDPGPAHEAAALRLLFPAAGACVAVAALVSLALPSRGVVAVRAAGGDWRLLLRNKQFIRVLVFSFITFLSTQGAMVLFPILVSAQGGGIESISRMWLLMLTLEVPLVFAFGSLVARLGPRGVIAIGTAAAAVRWLTSGFVEDLFVVGAVQVLHGVTVWGIILGVPFYVDRIVPIQLRATAQGLLAMAGISMGSILSNLAAGWLTEHYGATTPARVAGIASVALVLALPFLIGPVPVERDDAGANGGPRGDGTPPDSHGTREDEDG